MLPLLPALDKLPHAEFDTNYLRAFEDELPWYLVPQLWKTPFTPADFINDLRYRLRHFVDASNGGASRRLREQGGRYLSTHVCTLLAQGCIGIHTGQYDAQAIIESVRGDLRHVEVYGEFLLSDAMHPLYGDYRAEAVPVCDAREQMTPTEASAKRIRASREDRHAAAWLSANLVTWLESAAQEYLTRSPDCKIVEYAVRFRSELRTKLLGTKGPLDDRTRNECIDAIINEWIAVTAPLKPEKQIQDLERQAGIGDILTENPATVIKRVIEPALRSPEEFHRRRFVLEQLCLEFARRGEDVHVQQLRLVIYQCLRVHNLQYCDCPSLDIALLAMQCRLQTREEILSNI